jgi:hypothetical protein
MSRMSELIGVSIRPLNFKQQLLFLDRLACYLDRDWIKFDQDAQWLMERGLLLHPQLQIGGPNVPDRRAALAEIESLKPQSPPPQTAEELARWEHAMVRCYAALVRHQHSVNAVPLDTTWIDGVFQSATRADAVQLVIAELPIPDSQNSLEDVLAFRDEARSQGLMQALRVWISDVAAGRLSVTDLSDKLEELISRYEKALRLERLSRSTGRLETIVVTSAEVVELLATFQWSKLAKKLFHVRHKQIDLMKAEMTLPGREVAYIVKARERFGS